MKNYILSLLFLVPTLLLAHNGHPGAETHGTLTHMAVGILIALPFSLAVWGVIRMFLMKKSAQAQARKEADHG